MLSHVGNSVGLHNDFEAAAVCLAGEPIETGLPLPIWNAESVIALSLRDQQGTNLSRNSVCKPSSHGTGGAKYYSEIPVSGALSS